jgi:hypothetical protein
MIRSRASAPIAESMSAYSAIRSDFLLVIISIVAEIWIKVNRAN